MKKLLVITLIAILALAMTACQQTQKTTVVSSDDPIVENMNTSYLSEAQAIAKFKYNIHANVDGYELSYEGYLSGPEGKIGNIHTLKGEPTDYENCFYFKDASFFIVDGAIYKYQFGDVTGIYKFDDSIFCGNSYNVFVFRKGNELIYFYGNTLKEEVVAKGVKMVISCDYRFSSDFTGTLLLMEDNTLKVHIAAEDQLLDICYEGGYGGTHLGGYYF